MAKSSSPTSWPKHGKITGPIVMIGFGSIGKGTLPLIERHFDYDKSRFVDHRSGSRRPAARRQARRALHQRGRDEGQLPRTADAAAHRRRRPGLLRQPVGRHLLGRHHEPLPRDRRALCRHRRRAVARLLFRQERGTRGALELRAARDAARGQAQEPGRADRGLHLRRQSRHGVVVRQAGAAQHRQRTPSSTSRSRRAARTGPAGAEARRQGHPHRRARHPALEEAEADGHLRQHLVGRGLRLGGPAAGRARLGHA